MPTALTEVYNRNSFDGLSMHSHRIGGADGDVVEEAEAMAVPAILGGHDSPGAATKC